jgi:transcriptional regulator with XRE-family HTH domain
MASVRLARGISSGAAMAEALGLSQHVYNGFERGRTYPSPDVLGRFWQLTGATADYVLFGVVAGMPHELVKALKPVARAERGWKASE